VTVLPIVPFVGLLVVLLVVLSVVLSVVLFIDSEILFESNAPIDSLLYLNVKLLFLV
jgi:hypothetical protein